jgi:hypothetical protein
MENSEEILAVLKAVDDSLGRYMKFEIFDLCITNKRLVVINPKLHKWKAWLGINVMIQRRREAKKRQKQDPLRSLTVDELLEKDKSSYAVNYDDLDWICLNKAFFGSNFYFKGEKIWKQIKISKEQFKQLSQVLPRIDALKKKLEINQ